MELLGQCEGGASEEARYLYRLADGHAVEVPRLMHLVASRLDGNNVGEIARQVTDEVGRRLSPDNVTFLVEQKLRPLGLVAEATDDARAASPPTPLLGLRFRGALLPASVVRRATALLRPLFLPPVVMSVVATVVAIDIWLFLGHGLSEGVRQVLHQPVLVPAVWGVILLAGIFHELGHATACHYGGGRPGRIGFGLYLVWPVFYSDVTDSYRLGRRGRLRTDLGGLYFNAIFVLVSAGVYAVAGWEFALVVILLQHLAMLQQLLPFVRLDGYYVVSDMVGVADLFPYIKPIVRSVVFRRPPDRAVATLGRRARRVVSVWVLVTVPVLTASLALLVMQLPEWSATASESVTMRMRQLGEAIDEGSLTGVLGPVFEAAALVLPLVGFTLTLLLSIARAGRGLGRYMQSRAHRRRRDAEGLVETNLAHNQREGALAGKTFAHLALDDEREDDALVEGMTNDHPATGDARAPDHPVYRPDESGQLRHDGDGWDAQLDLGARLDNARARMDEEAQRLVQTLSRTVEAAKHELNLARTLRAKAEEEADAIRAAAGRDAADLLAHTRNGVQALLQELSLQLDVTSNETLAEPTTAVRNSSSIASGPLVARSAEPVGPVFKGPGDAAAVRDDAGHVRSGEDIGVRHDRSPLVDPLERHQNAVSEPTEARDGRQPSDAGFRRRTERSTAG